MLQASQQEDKEQRATSGLKERKEQLEFKRKNLNKQRQNLLQQKEKNNMKNQNKFQKQTRTLNKFLKIQEIFKFPVCSI
jgi:hypothetical protein